MENPSKIKTTAFDLKIVPKCSSQNILDSFLAYSLFVDFTQFVDQNCIFGVRLNDQLAN